MANPLPVISKERTLKYGSRDQFYDFFKSRANRLREICPATVPEIQLADGTSSWTAAPGNRKWVQYVFSSGVKERIKDEVITVDDRLKTIDFSVVEGALLQIYDTIEFKLEVTNASTSKWTISYKKKEATAAEPTAYLDLLDSISKAVDDSFAT